MSKRYRSDKNHRFSGAATDETAAIMDTSIGSDGERSDNDYDAEDVTPSTTPVSDIGAKLANGQRSNNFVFNLKFSIENILKPDFGRQQRNGVRGGVSDTSGSPPTFPATPSPLSSPQCMTSAAHGVNGRTSTSENLLSAINTPSVGSGNPPPTPGQTGTPASLWPAWVYCTRYSDRPSSGPRCRRVKRNKAKQDEKRPRTAFTVEQLSRLKSEFQENRYLTEKRRQDLARELGLNESQIKIWFQNKRAKIKKQTGGRNMLALHLMAQGLYNHATIPVVNDGMSPMHDDDGDMDQDDVDEDSSSKQ